MTMRHLKFTAGAFLEVDDLVGGRKVVLVGKDGVTFWDSIDTKSATPIVIHPVFNPSELGTLVEFIQANGLDAALKRVVAFLRARADRRLDHDPLLVMRMLWAIRGAGGQVDDAALRAAIENAEQQETTASQSHQYAERFVETGS